MNPAPADLAIVIVSWNVWDLLRACLESIVRQSEPTDDPRLRRFGPDGAATLRVLVVDNASADATPSLLPSRYPWVETILSDENLGFTGGNNRGLEALGFEVAERTGLQATGGKLQAGTIWHISTPATFHLPPSTSPHFVYFLNPDTELLPNSLWTLYAGITHDPAIGVIGPQLRYGDGSLQSTRRRFPSRLTGFFESTWLGRLWPGNPWARRYYVDDWSPTVRQDVDWLVGAALLVRAEALAAVGGFDPGFFMYSEETDLCKRIKSAGWRVVYEPGAMVIHYEGRSSEQASTQRQIRFNRSKVRYAGKYLGPFWAEFLRRYLLLEFWIQLMLEGAKALLGHRRKMRQERITAYRQVIASGLRPE
ncbi:MAG: glycosyltransferase family 2 protein [Chloroflexi bacterium]|nr:MAG: glycosyltransferase family 2 protein [Chloroflexota bacterium]